MQSNIIFKTHCNVQHWLHRQYVTVCAFFLISLFCYEIKSLFLRDALHANITILSIIVITNPIITCLFNLRKFTSAYINFGYWLVEVALVVKMPETSASRNVKCETDPASWRLGIVTFCRGPSMFHLFTPMQYAHNGSLRNLV